MYQEPKAEYNFKINAFKLNNKPGLLLQAYRVAKYISNRHNLGDCLKEYLLSENSKYNLTETPVVKIKFYINPKNKKND